MSKLTWEQRYVELLERIMAARVANMDLKPLQEQLQCLMIEKLSETKNDTAR